MDDGQGGDFAIVLNTIYYTSQFNFSGWLAKIIETEASLATPSIAKSLYTFTIKVNL